MCLPMVFMQTAFDGQTFTSYNNIKGFSQQ